MCCQKKTRDQTEYEWLELTVRNQEKTQFEGDSFIGDNISLADFDYFENTCFDRLPEDKNAFTAFGIYFFDHTINKEIVFPSQFELYAIADQALFDCVISKGDSGKNSVPDAFDSGPFFGKLTIINKE